jgi:hypothetical protein
MANDSSFLAMNVEEQMTKDLAKENLYPGINPSNGEMKTANPNNFLQSMPAISLYIKTNNLAVNLADTQFIRIKKKSLTNRTTSEDDHKLIYYNELRNSQYVEFMKDQKNAHYNNRTKLYIRLGLKIHKEHIADMSKDEKVQAEEHNKSDEIKGKEETFLLDSDPRLIKVWLDKFDSIYEHLARLDKEDNDTTISEITDLDIITNRLAKLGCTSKAKAQFDTHQRTQQKQSSQYEPKIKELMKLFTVIIHNAVLTTETKQLVENHEFAAAWKKFIHNELINKDYSDVLLLIISQTLLTTFDTDVHKSFNDYYNNLTSLHTVHLLRTHPETRLPYDKLTEIVDVMTDEQAEKTLKGAGKDGEDLKLPDMLNEAMRKRIVTRGLQQSNLQKQVDFIEQTHPDFTIKQMKESLDRYDRQHQSERKSARIEGVASVATEDRECESCSILHNEESSHTTHSANIACPAYNQDRFRSLTRDWKERQQQPTDRSYKYALSRGGLSGGYAPYDPAAGLRARRSPRQDRVQIAYEEKYCTHCARAGADGNLKREGYKNNHHSHECRIKDGNIEKRNNPKPKDSSKRPRSESSTQQLMQMQDTYPPYQYGQPYPYPNGYYPPPYQGDDFYRVGPHPQFVHHPGYPPQQQYPYLHDRTEIIQKAPDSPPPIRSASKERRQRNGGSLTSPSRSRSRSNSRDKT